MSQSIITVLDLINIQRLGPNLALNYAVDAGTGFNFDISGVIVPNPITTVASDTIGAISSGLTSYRLNADIDWTSLLIQIPINARISKIRIVCTGNYSAQASASADITPYPGSPALLIGTVSTGIFCQMRAPNSVYTETALQDIDASSVQQQSIPSGTFNLNTSIFNAGMFVEKTWDFTVLLPSGLPYITQPQLLTSFTNTEILCRTTVSLQAGARATTLLSLNTPGSVDIQRSAQMLLQTTLWEVIIDWESYVISSITPNPLNSNTPGNVTIVGTGLDTLTDLTIQYTDANGDPQTIPVTPTTQTAILIVFPWPYPPAYPPDGTGTYNGVVTIYSGAVALGTLTIYYATGAGMYKITSNQRHDTLYDPAGTTTDVAIPEPFFETGFIGG